MAQQLLMEQLVAAAQDLENGESIPLIYNDAGEIYELVHSVLVGDPWLSSLLPRTLIKPRKTSNSVYSFHIAADSSSAAIKYRVNTSGCTNT